MFPATQGQIDRMTMQRRVFDVDGRPHVVSRDGLYFETHATLVKYKFEILCDCSFA